ncbi:MAG: tetratricopeptide repeat protein [Emcibacteraceae bacterium]|nr:tetratricopeptide repeat protein [Emcibacteraceae bacterium]
MKTIQNITIILGTIFVLVIAFTGLDSWTITENNNAHHEYFALDPNNPNAEPIKLNGELEPVDYTFPNQNGIDFSKDAISKAILLNIRRGDNLVLGLLYERLAYLEFNDMNYGNARKSYNAALELYNDDHQKLRAAELLSQLAHLEARTKNYNIAKSYYEKSSRLFSQLNAPVRSDYTKKIAARLPVGD